MPHCLAALRSEYWKQRIDDPYCAGNASGWRIVSTRIMENSPGSIELCSDCRGLVEGTRSLPDAHRNQVFSEADDSDSRSVAYRCLICRSTLIYELTGRGGVWKVGHLGMRSPGDYDESA